MEDYIAEPVTSPISYQPAELSLWTHNDPIPDMYPLGSHRASSRLVPVCLCRDVGPTRTKFVAWEKSSAGDRVLGLGWWIIAFCRHFVSTGPDLTSTITRGGGESFDSSA